MMELLIDGLIRGEMFMIRTTLLRKLQFIYIKRPFGVAVVPFPSNFHYMAYTSFTITPPSLAISFMLEIGGIILGMDDG